MKYIKIFEFQAMDRSKEGKEVYMLDRACKEVYDVNYMSVGELANIINEGNATDRYEFWYEEDENEG